MLPKIENKGFTRETIKMTAMLTMACCHTAHIFAGSDTLLYLILTAVGNFTAPCMCYFLVEGFYKTSDRRRYLLRLLIFACLSQPFYHLALGPGLNMLFTLSACFLELLVLEKVKQGWLKGMMCLVIILSTAWMDWPVLAAVFTLVFYQMHDLKWMTVPCCGLVYVFCAAGIMDEGPLTILINVIPVLAAGVTVTRFYNKCRVTHGRKFFQWFFYLFYPAHLAVLYYIRCLDAWFWM